MNLNELEGKTIKTVKLSNQRVDENGSLSPFTYYWMQLVFEDGTHLSIDPYTSESSGLISTCFVDILLEQEPPDCMEDYAENCMGFEENDELAIAKSNDEVVK